MRQSAALTANPPRYGGRIPAATAVKSATGTSPFPPTLITTPPGAVITTWWAVPSEPTNLASWARKDVNHVGAFDGPSRQPLGDLRPINVHRRPFRAQYRNPKPVSPVGAHIRTERCRGGRMTGGGVSWARSSAAARSSVRMLPRRSNSGRSVAQTRRTRTRPVGVRTPSHYDYPVLPGNVARVP